ncbi:MAG: hypothetical protein AAB036_06495 [Elusimicrobiota bacterium]
MKPSISETPARWLPLLFFTVIGVIFVLHMAAYVDPDLFFHIKEGEKLVVLGRFPVLEEFSFTAAGKEMVATEWLADAGSFLIFRAAGYPGLVLFHAVLFLAALAVLFRFMRDDLPPSMRFLLVALAAFGLMNFIAVRVHAFTILFMSLYLFAIRLWEDGRRWVPWAMAAGLLVWVNIHGGFMLGWVTLGLVCLLEFKNTKRLVALAPWGLGTALCCVHPNGMTALLYPIWFMAMPPAGRSMILEWKPLDCSHPSSIPYLVMIGALCWVGIGAQRRAFPWALLTLMLLALGLRGRKLLPIFTLSAAASLSLTLRQSVLKPWQGRLCVTATAAILLAMGFLERKAPSSPNWRDWESGYPRAAAEFVSSRHPDARIFHPYTWGGYLIYKLSPKTKVFIDGRLDPYWSLLPNDYTTIMECLPGWRDRLADWAIDVAVLPRTTRLAHALGADPRWRPVFDDANTVVFALQR